MMVHRFFLLWEKLFTGFFWFYLFLKDVCVRWFPSNTLDVGTTSLYSITPSWIIGALETSAIFTFIDESNLSYLHSIKTYISVNSFLNF